MNVTNGTTNGTPAARPDYALALDDVRRARAAGVPERSREMAALKKEVVVKATAYLARACTGSYLYREKDVGYATAAFVSNFCSKDVTREIARLLVDREDEAAFEAYALEKMKATDEIYARYFDRHVSVRDGKLHSDILDADWDETAGSWLRVDEAGRASYVSAPSPV